MSIETTSQKPSRKITLQHLLFRYLPILDWLPHYKPAWLTADLIAGFTIRGMLVSENIAYAGLAGLPPQAGLYTLIIALPLYAIFRIDEKNAMLRVLCSLAHEQINLYWMSALRDWSSSSSLLDPSAVLPSGSDPHISTRDRFRPSLQAQ